MVVILDHQPVVLGILQLILLEELVELVELVGSKSWRS
jgi:hypothetical protein